MISLGQKDEKEAQFLQAKEWCKKGIHTVGPKNWGKCFNMRFEDFLPPNKWGHQFDYKKVVHLSPSVST